MIQTHRLLRVGAEEDLRRGEAKSDLVANQRTRAPPHHRLQMRRVPHM